MEAAVAPAPNRGLAAVSALLALPVAPPPNTDGALTLMGGKADEEVGLASDFAVAAAAAAAGSAPAVGVFFVVVVAAAPKTDGAALLMGGYPEAAVAVFAPAVAVAAGAGAGAAPPPPNTPGAFLLIGG